MLDIYPKFQRGQIEQFYQTLSIEEKTRLDALLEKRQARGLESKDKIADTRRYFLQLRYINESPFDDSFNNDSLVKMINIIKTSSLSDNVKKNLIIDLRSFMKILYTDWHLRFNSFEDTRTTKKKKRSKLNQKKINPDIILKKHEIEKMMQAEQRLYYKTFFIVQYEGALRTKETRYLRWQDVKLYHNGELSKLTIDATKTDTMRTVTVKEATKYLKLLYDEQKSKDKLGTYVFRSEKSSEKPISKTPVSLWMTDLSKRAIGRKIWNYILRHSRATELYTLARENKISKDTAIDFMGHSKDMSKVYEHLSEEEKEKIISKQVYDFEGLPEEQEHELVKQVNKLSQQNESLQHDLKELRDMVNRLVHGELTIIKPQDNEQNQEIHNVDYAVQKLKKVFPISDRHTQKKIMEVVRSL